MSSSSGFRGMSFDATCYDDRISEGVELCPFLRNIGVATSFSFSSFKFPTPAPVSFSSSSSSPSRFISSSACCCCKVKPCSHIVDHSSSVSCNCFSFKEFFFPTSCSALLFFCFFFKSLILSPFVFSGCRQELCVVRSLRMVQGLRMHFVFSMDEMAWFH